MIDLVWALSIVQYLISDVRHSSSLYFVFASPLAAACFFFFDPQSNFDSTKVYYGEWRYDATLLLLPCTAKCVSFFLNAVLFTLVEFSWDFGYKLNIVVYDAPISIFWVLNYIHPRRGIKMYAFIHWKFLFQCTNQAISSSLLRKVWTTYHLLNCEMNDKVSLLRGCT